MKPKKPFLNMDERSKLVAYRIIAIMYFLTVIAIQGVILYRQFALGQSIRDFEDLAIILTVNSLFLISALLYFGAVPIQKLRIKTILWGYLAIVVLGSLFTYLKYNIFQSPGLSFGQLIDKLLIISAISGLVVGFFILFSFLGMRKLDKELE
jgi:heme/copper-type cytochrome/quinol oxidase subunit 3